MDPRLKIIDKRLTGIKRIIAVSGDANTRHSPSAGHFQGDGWGKLS